MGELSPEAARADLNDRGPGALQVLGIVEVADEDAASVQQALAVLHQGDAVRIDVAVPRYSRSDQLGVMELPDEGGMVLRRCQRRRRCRESRPDEGGRADCQGEAASESHGFAPSASNGQIIQASSTAAGRSALAEQDPDNAGTEPALCDTSRGAARFSK